MRKKSRKEGFIEIVEEELKNRIVDICDEYKSKKFVDGVSVFVGYPGLIIEAIREQLKKL